MKIDWDHIETDDEFYYFWWWNWLPKRYRYLGPYEMLHDCAVHKTFGFWFCNISWHTKWSKETGRRPWINNYKGS